MHVLFFVLSCQILILLADMIIMYKFKFFILGKYFKLREMSTLVDPDEPESMEISLTLILSNCVFPTAFPLIDVWFLL